MSNGKTIGELIEEMRLKAGAKEYHGHEYMALERFADDTRHMIIFDVLTKDSPVGWQGERTRLFLTDEGYRKSLENQEKGQHTFQQNEQRNEVIFPSLKVVVANKQRERNEQEDQERCKNRPLLQLALFYRRLDEVIRTFGLSANR